MSISPELKQAFGLFGDDSDEEVLIQQPFKDEVKKRNCTKRETNNSKELNHKFLKPDDYQCCEPVLWKHHKPQFMGPVLFSDAVDDVGGSRGYIASQDIHPGGLIMIESALIEWPKSAVRDNLFIDTLRFILNNEEHCDDWMTCMSMMHPVSLDDLPPDIVKAGLEKYQGELENLENEKEISFDRMLQILFAMQSNAFSSGIFLHCSIFNHSCQPNCVKFNPSNENPKSEVRASRMIHKGEPLSISYLTPPEQSQVARQEQLRKQFGFTCECQACLEPPGYRYEAFMEIERQIPHAEELLENGHLSLSLARGLEIFNGVLEILPYNAMELIRIHKLVANCTAELLKHNNDQFLEHAILFLRSSYKLYKLQKKHSNRDHLDLARTLSDLSQGIQILLSKCPEALFAEFDEWSTFRDASIAENEFRKEHNRINMLYS